MSCAFIDVGSMAMIQTENPHGIDGCVSLVPLDSQLAALQQSGQIFVQTNDSSQPLSCSPLEPHQQIQLVEQQQPTLLLVSTNPDENSGQVALTSKIINHSPPVQMQQQLLLVTDLQGSNTGTLIQMPSSASVIQVPGIISNGNQTVTFIGAPQSNQVAIDSSNTVLVTNSGNGDIILCLQPGDVTTLQLPPHLVVDGMNGCFATAIDSPPNEVNQSALARSWQVDSDLVNRALNALSSQSSPTSVDITNPAMEHNC